MFQRSQKRRPQLLLSRKSVSGDDDDHPHQYHRLNDHDRLHNDPPEMIAFSFDTSSDEEEQEEEENDTDNDNGVYHQGTGTMIALRSILKHNSATTTFVAAPSGPTKRVQWSSTLVTHEKMDTAHPVWYTASEPTCRADDVADLWLTPHDLAQLKQGEKELYYRHVPINDDNWQQFPTAKMYLFECRCIYEWMQAELLVRPTTAFGTTYAQTIDSVNDDHSTGQGHTPPHQHQQLQPQQNNHPNNHNNWSHEDFFHFVLDNSPILWHGWSDFRGLESARPQWRKDRNKRIVQTILQLQTMTTTTTTTVTTATTTTTTDQNNEKNRAGMELAVSASQLTAADAIWANFVAVGDEQQLAKMDDIFYSE